MKLPATIARLAELTGGVACSTSDGLSEHVVKSAVWRTIAAAVRIREFVTNNANAYEYTHVYRA